MNVKDLRAKLESLDENLEVYCYTEDEELLKNQHKFRLLETDGIEVNEGVWNRSDDGIPSIHFGKQPNSEKIILINVTVNF